MNIQIKQKGPMAFCATTSNGHSVTMDAAKEVGGEDKGPRPMEMLLMGLGGCTAIDVVLILKKARQNIKDCRISIDAKRSETEPKVFTQIHVHFIVKGTQLSPERVKRAIKLSADKYCSASIMLGKTAKISHDFEVVEA